MTKYGTSTRIKCILQMCTNVCVLCCGAVCMRFQLEHGVFGYLHNIYVENLNGTCEL